MIDLFKHYNTDLFPQYMKKFDDYPHTGEGGGDFFPQLHYLYLSLDFKIEP